MANNYGNKGKGVAKPVATRQAADGGSSNAEAGGVDQTQGDAPAADKPRTSGDLNYRPMRIWQRRQRCKPYVEQQLSQTAYVLLGEDTKKALLEAIDKCLTDDINEFMDTSMPRALYPYAEKVQAAIRTVFGNNIALYKCLGAEGVDENGQEIDSFGQRVDEPFLEELFYEGKN